MGGDDALVALDAEIKETEAACDAAYKAAFPDGPEPIFVAHRDNPEEMVTLKRVFGREALEKAFGDGGGGMREVMANLERGRRSVDSEESQ